MAIEFGCCRVEFSFDLEVEQCLVIVDDGDWIAEIEKRI